MNIFHTNAAACFVIVCVCIVSKVSSKEDAISGLLSKEGVSQFDNAIQSIKKDLPKDDCNISEIEDRFQVLKLLYSSDDESKKRAIEILVTKRRSDLLSYALIKYSDLKLSPSKIFTIQIKITNAIAFLGDKRALHNCINLLRVDRDIYAQAPTEYFVLTRSLIRAILVLSDKILYKDISTEELLKTTESIKINDAVKVAEIYLEKYQQYAKGFEEKIMNNQ